MILGKLYLDKKKSSFVTTVVCAKFQVFWGLFSFFCWKLTIVCVGGGGVVW
jgi:hypothetical protein